MTIQSITETQASRAMSNANAMAMSPSALLSEAFKLDTSAAKASNKGTQTMAAGIFAFYNEIGQSHGILGATKPKYDAFKERGQAFNDFRAAILTASVDGKRFITARISSKDQKADTKITSAMMVTNNAENAAQMVALNKGFDLCDVLHSVGIDNTQYDVKTRTFSVAMATMLRDDELALPLSAAKGAVAPERIALDGTTYPIFKDGRPDSFKAYPARILALRGKQKKNAAINAATTAQDEVKGANETATTGGASASVTRDTVTTWSVEKYLSSAAELIDKAIEILSEDDAPFSLADMTEKERNALTRLASLYDQAKAYDEQMIRDTKKAANG